MSGDTVSGNALQFTNDNKYAYAFSGEIGAGTGDTDILEFQTQSEYLIARIGLGYGGARSNDDFQANLLFNGITVAEETYNNNYETASPQFFKVIIPPFTTVKVSITKLVGTISIPTFAYLKAEVGMAARVGNLDE
jgi:hypothetical protein